MKMILFTLRTISTNFTVGIAIPSGTTVKFAQSLVTRMSIDLDAGTNITIVINEEVKFKLNFKEKLYDEQARSSSTRNNMIIGSINLIGNYISFNIIFNF